VKNVVRQITVNFLNARNELALHHGDKGDSRPEIYLDDPARGEDREKTDKPKGGGHDRPFLGEL
jgi:hypothetical protein